MGWTCLHFDGRDLSPLIERVGTDWGQKNPMKSTCPHCPHLSPLFFHHPRGATLCASVKFGAIFDGKAVGFGMELRQSRRFLATIW